MSRFFGGVGGQGWCFWRAVSGGFFLGGRHFSQPGHSARTFCSRPILGRGNAPARMVSALPSPFGRAVKAISPNIAMTERPPSSASECEYLPDAADFPGPGADWMGAGPGKRRRGRLRSDSSLEGEAGFFASRAAPCASPVEDTTGRGEGQEEAAHQPSEREESPDDGVRCAAIQTLVPFSWTITLPVESGEDCSSTLLSLMHLVHAAVKPYITRDVKFCITTDSSGARVALARVDALRSDNDEHPDISLLRAMQTVIRL